MINRIFHKRLQQKVQSLVWQNLLINVHDHIKIIIVHAKLDLQIRLHVLNFLLNCQNILATVERCPVKRRKRQRDLTDILLPCFERLPVDQRKRIIQEMRIDLRLKCCHFRLSLRQLTLIHLMDQPVDFSEHASEATDQTADLISGIAGNHQLHIAFLNRLHIVTQTFDIAHHEPRKCQGCHHRCDDTYRDNSHDKHKQRLNLSRHHFLRLIDDDLPVIHPRIRGNDQIIAFLSVLLRLHFLFQSRKR